MNVTSHSYRIEKQMTKYEQDSLSITIALLVGQNTCSNKAVIAY